MVSNETNGTAGTELWRFDCTAAVPSSPTVVDDTVYVGN